ncbi:MAG: GatB/YqeY domain-containing protein [Paludibacteraceae bacterium]|nr:GatB/YqeY domain-containing protein [Paludibacteraceae bacterium]
MNYGKIYTTIENDIVSNVKSKNLVDLTILRTLKADINKVIIDKKIEDVTDDIVIDVVSKCVKQFNDSVEMMKNNEEKVSEYKHKIEVISKYLPEQMSEEDVLKIVNQVKVNTNATTKKDMGKMMKELTPMLKGKFDSKRLSAIVNSILE